MSSPNARLTADATGLAALMRSPACVPCNGCRACCISDVIVLRDEEAGRFQWHLEHGAKVLDRKENGECAYLGPNGCRVHQAPPQICRNFDCRVLFLTTPKAVRRIRVEQNPSMSAVYEAGKRRLQTLKPT